MTRGKVFFMELVFCLIGAAFSPHTSSANPEYARATGKQCIQCHGGSEIARQRLLFRQSPARRSLCHRLLPAGPFTRFLTGRIGVIAATGWFAAMLYSCLVRKRNMHVFAKGGIVKTAFSNKA